MWWNFLCLLFILSLPYGSCRHGRGRARGADLKEKTQLSSFAFPSPAVTFIPLTLCANTLNEAFCRISAACWAASGACWVCSFHGFLSAVLASVDFVLDKQSTYIFVIFFKTGRLWLSCRRWSSFSRALTYWTVSVLSLCPCKGSRIGCSDKACNIVCHSSALLSEI